MKKNNQKHIIKSSSLIKEALKRLNSLAKDAILFVVDINNKLIGSLTDGDVRRGLIKGVKVNDPITKIIEPSYKFILEGKIDINEIIKLREDNYKVLPVIDSNGVIVDIVNFRLKKSYLPLDAVIMAGGLGSRLKPYTDNIPKPLLKVGDKEIISYNFDRLSKYGISNQYVTVNYLGSQIEDFCNNYNEEINFVIIKEEEFLGTAGSMSLIDKFQNDTILLMNSDLLTNINYEDFYLSFIEAKADIMVASVPYNLSLPYAVFETTNNNQNIISFKEKPTYTHYINAGIYLIKKSMLKHIPKNQFYNATDLMNSVINNKGKLIHYPITGYWLDIGKRADFKKAQKDIHHINFD